MRTGVFSSEMEEALANANLSHMAEHGMPLSEDESARLAVAAIALRVDEIEAVASRTATQIESLSKAFSSLRSCVERGSIPND